MDLDSGLLRAFVATADARHFGRAAEELVISQQALSKRIARLEGLLGVRLLDRDRRSVALTDAGAGLLPAARSAVDSIDAAVAAVTGRATVAVDVLDDHLSMLPALRTVAGRLDGLEVVARSRGAAESAMGVLRSGAADLALARPGAVPDPWPKELVGEPLLAEALELLVPEVHPWSGRDRLSLAELAGTPLWFPTYGAPGEWTDLLGELATTFGLEIDRRGATMGFEHWVATVAAGNASPSLLGAGMALPPGIAVARVALVDPTPLFWWWVLHRRRLDRRTADTLVAGLRDALVATGPIGPDAEDLTAGRTWLPVADRAFVRESRPVPRRGRLRPPEDQPRTR